MVITLQAILADTKRNAFLTITLCLFICFVHGQINRQEIIIARDSFGVPHIFGHTDAEAAYGLAWAHCEDDFKDIQENLLAAKGMLGKVIRKEGVLFPFAIL
jgi:acyl-homoserine-lactone acylase